MSIWDQLKDTASKAAGQLGEKISEAAETGKTEFEVLKVKRQISATEEEIDDLFRDLGRRTFELSQSGGLEDSESQGLASEIEAKKQAIEGFQAEIEKIREEADEVREERESERRSKSEEEDAKRRDEEEGIDGEAVWEDDDDDGTPPPP